MNIVARGRLLSRDAKIDEGNTITINWSVLFAGRGPLLPNYFVPCSTFAAADENKSTSLTGLTDEIIRECRCLSYLFAG